MNKYLITGIFLLWCVGMNAQTKKDSKIGDKIYDAGYVHDIRLNFAHCSYWDSLIHYKEHYKNKLEMNMYLQGNVQVNSKMYYAVGVRIKGESSYDYTPGNKKSIKIKFNKYIKQDLNNVTTINLNNGFKDPTFLREKLFFDIFQKEGIPAPRIAYANLYINDQNFGLYLISEHVNRRFLDAYFGNKGGSLYQGEPKATFEYIDDNPESYKSKYQVEHKNKKIRQDLVDLIKIVNDKKLKGEKFEQAIERVLNIENVLKVFAITNVFCNVDAYNMIYPHNFLLYKNTKTDVFEWIPYDGNYAFCAWSPVFKLKEAEQLSILYKHKENPNPLYVRLISNKKYKEFYINYVEELLDKYFNEEYIEDEIVKNSLLIRKYVYADTMKMYSNDEFETNLFDPIGDVKDPGAFIPGLKSFWINRGEAIRKELKKMK